MAWLVNRQPNVLSIGNVVLTPNIPAKIDDIYLENPRVKALMEQGYLQPSTHEEVRGIPAKGTDIPEPKPPVDPNTEVLRQGMQRPVPQPQPRQPPVTTQQQRPPQPTQPAPQQQPPRRT